MKWLLLLAIALITWPIALIFVFMTSDLVMLIRRDGWDWHDVFAVSVIVSMVLGGALLITLSCMGAFQ